MYFGYLNYKPNEENERLKSKKSDEKSRIVELIG